MKDIVTQVINGDKDAFRGIVTRYGPEIRVFLASSVSDYQTVDDLAQETFIATYNSLEKFNPELDLRSWIYGIARNKLNMHLRRIYRQKDRMCTLSEEIIDNLVGAMEDRINEQDSTRVSNLKYCIDALPEKGKAIIETRYFTKKTVIEMASMLDRTENAMSVALYRLRALLRKCIESRIQG